MTTIRILSADTLPLDVVVSLALEADAKKSLGAHAEKKGFGTKNLLLEKEFKALSLHASKIPHTECAGGSIANSLSTICKALPHQVSATMLSATGDGYHGSINRASLEEAGIMLIPDTSGKHVVTEISIVPVSEEGRRAIFTYRGNAEAFVTPALVTDELVAEHDVIWVNGSSIRKFDPEVAFQMADKAVAQEKELWMSLPTQKENGEVNRTFFERLINHNASLIFSNDDELRMCYGTEKLQEAKQQLQKALRQRKVSLGGKTPIAFVTQGKGGCVVMTPEEMIEVPAISVGTVVNTLGAGDTSYGGFLTGYVQGWPLKQCAELAMHMAAEKVQINETRLADPKTSLELFLLKND